MIQVFSCEFCEIFKDTFSTEHLRTTISVQFTMYFATGYNKFVFSDTYCNRVYKTINYFETPLGDKTTTIFTCCLALDNKIERLRSVISLTKLSFDVLKNLFL